MDLLRRSLGDQRGWTGIAYRKDVRARSSAGGDGGPGNAAAACGLGLRRDKLGRGIRSIGLVADDLEQEAVWVEPERGVVVLVILRKKLRVVKDVASVF